MKINLTVLLIILGISIFATEQAYDKVFYADKKLYLRTEEDYSPLIQYLKQNYSRSPFKDTSKYIYGFSSGLHRGFTGEWNIEDNRLYLARINIGSSNNSLSLKTMFGKRVKQDKVFADWFTGLLYIQENRYASKEIVLMEVKKGFIKQQIILPYTVFNKYFRDRNFTDEAKYYLNLKYKYLRLNTENYLTQTRSEKIYARVYDEIVLNHKKIKQDRKNERVISDAKADSLSSSLDGFAVKSRFFEVNHTMMNGCYHERESYICVQNNGKLIGLDIIDRVTWLNPLVDEKPQFTWLGFEKYATELGNFIKSNKWLNSDPNILNLSISTKVLGITNINDNLLGIPWEEAGFIEKPFIELTIQKSRAIYAYLFEADKRILITTSRLYDHQEDIVLFELKGLSEKKLDKYNHEYYIINPDSY